MRSPFQFNKTLVSMRFAELKPADLGIYNAPKSRKDEIVSTEWQVIYTKDGCETIHMAFPTEQEADVAMDEIKANADALNNWNPNEA